jgi:O-acetyl-ADP-ribose deacetylase (regulator of RNase III)
VRVTVKSGDILDGHVDVLVCSANAQLNLSGGVGGALLLRGGLGVQQELHALLAREGRRCVPARSVFRTGPGPLNVRHILHAVAVDAFYMTSQEVVAETIARALSEAARLGAATVALTALATGYGRMDLDAFASALATALGEGDYAPLREVRVVVRHEHEAEALRALLARGAQTPAARKGRSK